MFVTMVLAALVDRPARSDLAGLIPSGPRPSRSAIFGAVHVDYKLALNALGLASVRGPDRADDAPRGAPIPSAG